MKAFFLEQGNTDRFLKPIHGRIKCPFSVLPSEKKDKKKRSIIMNCEGCKNEFEPTRNWQRFCSFACQTKTKFLRYYKKNKKRIVMKARDYENKTFLSASDKYFHANYVRPAVLKRDCYNCVKCGSDKSLEANHKRYGKDLTISDFETLCKSCHKQLHVGLKITNTV